MNYKMVRIFKGLEAKRLHCHWRFCPRKASGTGRWCHEHKNNLYRYGHQDAKLISSYQYREFVEPAMDHILATKDTEATKLALYALDNALNPAYIPTSPRYYKVHEALVRLKNPSKTSSGRRWHKPVSTEMLLAEAMALHRYVALHTEVYLNEGVFWIMVARAMLRLKPRAVRFSTINPETWKQECKYDRGLSAKALKLLANRLSEAAKLYIVDYAAVVAKQGERDRLMKLALEGYHDDEEKFQAQLADARQRAARLREESNAQAVALVTPPASPTPADSAEWWAGMTASERQIELKRRAARTA